LTFVVAAQDERPSLDGFGNNIENPSWGAVDDQLLNRCRVGFADSLSSPAHEGLPNPRTVSNVLGAQPNKVSSQLGLNDLWWAFGQFVDHDITLTEDDEHEFMGIVVPQGDFMFDPDSTGRAMIPMMRSAWDQDAEGVRRYRNEISAFLDGSAVYGSSVERSNYLRSFSNGRLRTSSGDLPIFNTLNGEYAAPVDTTAPAMAGQRSPQQRLLVCGDVRANENSLLASLHTVWMREHNRLADSLALDHQDWTDEQLFEAARRLIRAQLQHVVYEEWLPVLGVEIAGYSGYDASVHPGIGNEFAAAGFRFGHSLVGSELLLQDSDGSALPNSPLQLREVFFDPISIIQQNGMEPLLRGAAAHAQQAMDCKVVDDLRNFLFGAPGAGGLDLLAININRGRDRGVASFNVIREDLGLAPYAKFEDLTGELELASLLASLYTDINDVDAWVGFLIEKKTDGVGPTLRTHLDDQFSRLRNGDRFYYEAEGQFSATERSWIQQQTLAKIISRNSEARLVGESFKVQSAVSSYGKAAFAKTRPDWQARVTPAGAVWVEGLEADAKLSVTYRDLLGRTLIRKDASATGFGESRLLSIPMEIQNSPSAPVAITIADDTGRQLSVITSHRPVQR